jgi:hypothetical protein
MKLTWRPVRVIFPVRFTHDADGWALLHQPGRRRSRWFENVERSDDPRLLVPPAYRPRRALEERK